MNRKGPSFFRRPIVWIPALAVVIFTALRAAEYHDAILNAVLRPGTSRGAEAEAQPTPTATPAIAVAAAATAIPVAKASEKPAAPILASQDDLDPGAKVAASTVPSASPAPTASPGDLLVPDAPKPAAAVAGAKPDDDLLLPAPGAKADDDLLSGPALLPTPIPGAAASTVSETLPPLKKQPTNPVDPHKDLYAKSRYPSASECATCHEQIYNEWRSSNHAYASISPVFHKFEQKINDLAQGTIGYFCMRCHAGVGTSLNEPRYLPLWQKTEVSREGVTCITCHRVREQYTKVNGERAIITGDIFQPMYGSRSGKGVAEVVANPDVYHIKTKADLPGPGMNIHKEGIKFDPISTSEFCVSCHQVAVHPGIKLEVVWDQFRSSPSLSKGTTCQDCHMGKEPGVVSGYATGTAAVVGGIPINPGRKHANHAFYGPGYPIAHPGIFPHNPKAAAFAIETWLKFDWRAGWGTDAFEKKVAKGTKFPSEWESADDRYSAREIIKDNLAMLEQKRHLRERVMENGSHVDGPFFQGELQAGKSLSFTYKITNVNPGHNMPSGSLGAQPEIWMNAALFNPQGKLVWESGYTDSHGDMADLHSRDVRTGKIPDDRQLVNLQTKFLTTNVKGTDREMYLPINLDFDQLPFIRPAGVPTTVMNHPPFVRMEQRSIPPLANRIASYKAPASAMTMPGKYKLSVRLRSRAEPIYFMDFVEATPEMDRAMNEWMIDMHRYSVEFEVPAAK
jgi:nitrate/TMAO reductase-like tetraheme cytochrome c subunit